MAFTYKGQSNPSGTIRFRQSRSLLASQSDLEQIFTDLEIMAKEGTADRDAILSNVRAARFCLPAMDKAIPKKHKRLLYPERGHDKGLAQKVFDITELLEMILAHLKIGELLAAQFINRQFRDIINESTTLQRILMLEAHNSGVFSAPFEEAGFPGLECHASSKPHTWTEDIDYNLPKATERVVYVKAQFLNKKLKIGSRCRRMHLTQPPSKEISTLVECCGASKLIWNWSGITIGDLVDTARALEEEHSRCQEAHPAKLNEHDGSARRLSMLRSR